ncbi:hypothetical protein LEN26_016270 [Aphanomyces euteiches]|nr:hypothetical protein LEN26_016270 [Aphanomyces euteiches]KAH9124011.1 hypothetical protein AeMF1_005151 [Aphanomyces euteiches]KAH9184251.1 hypothetical protein AeNC1_013772 [Aphanomyces euteiches]
MIPGLDVAVATVEKIPAQGLHMPYVEFEVQRTYRSDYHSWKCRFSDFCTLADELKKSHDLDNIKAEFPPKTMQLPYVLPSDAKLEERRAMLDLFLKALPHTDLSPEGHHAVRAFLKLDSVHLEPPSQGGLVSVPPRDEKTASEPTPEDEPQTTAPTSAVDAEHESIEELMTKATIADTEASSKEPETKGMKLKSVISATTKPADEKPEVPLKTEVHEESTDSTLNDDDAKSTSKSESGGSLVESAKERLEAAGEMVANAFGMGSK